MPLLSRLLLVPLLAPLLAVLLVAALNPRPALSGFWLALAGLGGGALSAAATTLALSQGQEPRRRTVRRPGGAPAAWSEPWEQQPDLQEIVEPARREQRQPGASAAPVRPPGEPPPTLSVPFRVIRRAPERAEKQPAGTAAPAARGPGTARVSVGDGWEQPLQDDW
jgi:hypothetical protein